MFRVGDVVQITSPMKMDERYRGCVAVIEWVEQNNKNTYSIALYHVKFFIDQHRRPMTRREITLVGRPEENR